MPGLVHKLPEPLELRQAAAALDLFTKAAVVVVREVAGALFLGTGVYALSTPNVY